MDEFLYPLLRFDKSCIAILPMKGLRRNDGAIKNKCRYYSRLNKIIKKRYIVLWTFKKIYDWQC